MISQPAIVRIVRRSAVVVACFQAVTWLLIGLFGFGAYPGAPVLGYVLAASQVFGIDVLARLGWCCGLGGGFVISDVALNRWGGLSLAGAPVLFLANGIVLLVLLVALRLGLYGLRAVRRSA